MPDTGRRSARMRAASRGLTFLPFNGRAASCTVKYILNLPLKRAAFGLCRCIKAEKSKEQES